MYRYILILIVLIFEFINCVNKGQENKFHFYLDGHIFFYFLV